MVAKAFRVADLFCGAGGTSTGVRLATEAIGRKLDLVAVNHWDRAVETHAANHPAAAHFCQSLADLDPRKAVPSGKLDLLVASPECTHHSIARGGKPVNDQSRASAWCVLRWCTALAVDRVLIENVPEFQTWGPIGTNGRPLASKRGETFGAFVRSLESLGYRVEWRVLNAADYGGATTRRRLFIQAARGRRSIHWPAPTHEPEPKAAGLFGMLPRWRAAREVIDWTLTGDSIFTRRRPLSENTLRRIEAGLIKFGGAAAQPFLVALHHMKNADGDGRACRSVDAPLPTILAGGTHIAMVEPFLMSAGGPKVGARPVSQPANTVLTRDHMGLCEAFIVPTNYGEREGQSPRCHSIDRPVPTVVAGGQTHAVVQPFVMHTTHHGEGRVYDPADPLPCVTGANRGEQAVVQPFILPPEGIHRGNLARPVNGPMQTITAARGGGTVVEPFVVPFYANGQAESLADPLRTITTRDRFGLVQPDGTRIDIRFRMLQPHELSKAMGFPDGYRITGNRSEQVRQVGNAVEVNQARALVGAILEAN